MSGDDEEARPLLSTTRYSAASRVNDRECDDDDDYDDVRAGAVDDVERATATSRDSGHGWSDWCWRARMKPSRSTRTSWAVSIASIVAVGAFVRLRWTNASAYRALGLERIGKSRLQGTEAVAPEPHLGWRRPGTWHPSRGNGWHALIPKVRAPKGPVTTFTLHTQCNTPRVREAYAEFWLDGEKEYYIVKHNYESHRFFEHSNAIKMHQVELESGELAYQVNASSVDFEFGYAVKNVDTNRWIYEIGGKDTPLGMEKCAHRHGVYWNRMMTHEEKDSVRPKNVEYKFASCNTDCTVTADDGAAETSYDLKRFSTSVPPCDNDSLHLGEGDDARLVTLRTGVLIKPGLGPSGRALIVRDTQFTGESETHARWLLSNVDGYPDLAHLHIVALDVKMSANGTMYACQADQKDYVWDNTCSGIQCSTSIHDIPTLWRETSNVQKTYQEFYTTKLEWTIGRKGDSRGREFSKAFTDDAYLTTYTIAKAGAWGNEIDVRRVIPTSAGACGSAWASGNGCIRMFAIEPYVSVKPTASERLWIAGAVWGDFINMVQLRVFEDDGALKIQAVGGGKSPSGNPVPADKTTASFHESFDALRSPNGNLTALWDRSDRTTEGVATSLTSGGLGVGSLAWLLAPNMVPSLARVD